MVQKLSFVGIGQARGIYVLSVGHHIPCHYRSAGLESLHITLKNFYVMAGSCQFQFLSFY